MNLCSINWQNEMKLGAFQATKKLRNSRKLLVLKRNPEILKES